MRTRPHTKFVDALKQQRCPKCGTLLGTQRKRCKRCAEIVVRPKKRQTKKRKRRQSKFA